MKLKVKKLRPDAVVPKYGTEGASGFDFVAVEDTLILTGQTELVKTGLAMAIDQGYELQVRPRSGMSLKTPLRVSNAPGTVDSDFRGEICVIMTNTSRPFQKDDGTYDSGAYLIKKGDRIAQGVICPIVQVEFDEVDDLDDTVRGLGAFGSTGTN